MPIADPLRRRLYQRAISRARIDVCQQHWAEYQKLVHTHFQELLDEHGLEED